jgi:hypothetical protein
MCGTPNAAASAGARSVREQPQSKTPKESIQTLLFEKVAAGDTKFVEDLLLSDPAPAILLADLRNANHDSALHKCKSDDMMDLLLRSRANPNAVNIQGETALCTVPAGLVHSLLVAKANPFIITKSRKRRHFQKAFELEPMWTCNYCSFENDSSTSTCEGCLKRMMVADAFVQKMDCRECSSESPSGKEPHASPLFACAQCCSVLCTMHDKKAHPRRDTSDFTPVHERVQLWEVKSQQSTTSKIQERKRYPLYDDRSMATRSEMEEQEALNLAYVLEKSRVEQKQVEKEEQEAPDLAYVLEQSRVEQKQDETARASQQRVWEEDEGLEQAIVSRAMRPFLTVSWQLVLRLVLDGLDELRQAQRASSLRKQLLSAVEALSGSPAKVADDAAKVADDTTPDAAKVADDTMPDTKETKESVVKYDSHSPEVLFFKVYQNLSRQGHEWRSFPNIEPMIFESPLTPTLLALAIDTGSAPLCAKCRHSMVAGGFFLTVDNPPCARCRQAQDVSVIDGTVKEQRWWCPCCLPGLGLSHQSLCFQCYPSPKDLEAAAAAILMMQDGWKVTLRKKLHNRMLHDYLQSFQQPEPHAAALVNEQSAEEAKHMDMKRQRDDAQQERDDSQQTREDAGVEAIMSRVHANHNSDPAALPSFPYIVLSNVTGPNRSDCQGVFYDTGTYYGKKNLYKKANSDRFLACMIQQYNILWGVCREHSLRTHRYAAIMYCRQDALSPALLTEPWMVHISGSYFQPQGNVKARGLLPTDHMELPQLSKLLNVFDPWLSHAPLLSAVIQTSQPILDSNKYGTLVKLVDQATDESLTEALTLLDPSVLYEQYENKAWMTSGSSHRPLSTYEDSSLHSRTYEKYQRQHTSDDENFQLALALSASEAMISESNTTDGSKQTDRKDTLVEEEGSELQLALVLSESEAASAQKQSEDAFDRVADLGFFACHFCQASLSETVFAYPENLEHLARCAGEYCVHQSRRHKCTHFYRCGVCSYEVCSTCLEAWQNAEIEFKKKRTEKPRMSGLPHVKERPIFDAKFTCAMRLLRTDHVLALMWRCNLHPTNTNISGAADSHVSLLYYAALNQRYDLVKRMIEDFPDVTSSGHYFKYSNRGTRGVQPFRKWSVITRDKYISHRSKLFLWETFNRRASRNFEFLCEAASDPAAGRDCTLRGVNAILGVTFVKHSIVRYLLEEEPTVATPGLSGVAVPILYWGAPGLKEHEQRQGVFSWDALGLTSQKAMRAYHSWLVYPNRLLDSWQPSGTRQEGQDTRQEGQAATETCASAAPALQTTDENAILQEAVRAQHQADVAAADQQHVDFEDGSYMTPEGFRIYPDGSYIDPQGSAFNHDGSAYYQAASHEAADLKAPETETEYKDEDAGNENTGGYEEAGEESDDDGWNAMKVVKPVFEAKSARKTALSRNSSSPPSQTQSEPKSDLERDAELRAQVSTPQSANQICDGYWACGTCTFNNPAENRKCTMCSQRRPSHLLWWTCPQCELNTGAMQCPCGLLYCSSLDAELPPPPRTLT